MLYDPALQCTITVVSSSDRHALWAKDGLEQLLQILGSSLKHSFHLKVNSEHRLSSKHVRCLDQFEATVPDHLWPVGCGSLGTRLLALLIIYLVS